MATTPGAWKTWGVCSPHAAGRPCLPLLVLGHLLSPDVLCPLPECQCLVHTHSPSHTGWSQLRDHPVARFLTSFMTLIQQVCSAWILCHKSGDHVCPVPVNVSCHTSSGSYGFVVSRVSWGSHPHRALRRAGQVAMFLSVSVVLRQCHHLQISALLIHFPRCPPSFYPHALMLSQGISLFCDKSHTFKREMSFAGGFFWSLIYFYKWAFKWIFKVWKAFRISQKWSTEVLGE